MNKPIAFKLITILGTPVLVLLLAELALSITGYRSTYEREDPFLGFQAVSPLFEAKLGGGAGGQRVFASRESKLPWFNYQEFAATKPLNGYRVFSFGGSTTFGRPYGYETAFSNWLELLLTSSDPATSYEVVNVGGVSYASYRVVNLMQEMFEYGPDLFIVYTGHNEFLEERTYSDLFQRSPTVAGLQARLHRLRSYSLVRDTWLSVRGREQEEAERKFQMSGEVTAILDQTFGLEHYRRDPESHDAILSHFRFNLERMVDLADDHDVGLIFVVPPSNEAAFSPFKSQPCRPVTAAGGGRWVGLYDEGRERLSQRDFAAAAAALQEAASLDPCHADLRYRLAQAYLGLGRHEEAKREFVAARDQDVAPLRATSRIQGTVREVASQRGVPLVDLVAILEEEVRETEGHTILGAESFLDHAHPTIRVHQRVAEEVTETLFELGWVEAERPVEPAETTALYDSVMASLDGSYHAVRDLNLAKVLSWLGKDEEAAPFVARAAEALPDHPEAQYLQGVFLQAHGRYPDAERAYVKALVLDSTFARAHNALASLYERAGLPDAAIGSIRQALRYEPESDNAYFSLGNALYGTGRVEEAIEAYREALRLNPRNSRAWNNLAAVHITRESYDEAIVALERTLELEPQNVSAYKNLGLCHYNMGRPTRARSMFETVLRIQPGDDFAIRWIERLDDEARQ
ncbi:MAG: tetratricopeptide repeat protein [Gemmatimonadetes bacterium]|nr:tetratricopeptide repeat protein [Gemmatimonadota bacterium]